MMGLKGVRHRRDLLDRGTYWLSGSERNRGEFRGWLVGGS